MRSHHGAHDDHVPAVSLLRSLFFGVVGGVGGRVLFGLVTPVVATWHVKAGAGILRIPTPVPFLAIAAGVVFGVWWAIRPKSHAR